MCHILIKCHCNRCMFVHLFYGDTLNQWHYHSAYPIFSILLILCVGVVCIFLIFGVVPQLLIFHSFACLLTFSSWVYTYEASSRNSYYLFLDNHQPFLSVVYMPWHSPYFAAPAILTPLHNVKLGCVTSYVTVLSTIWSILPSIDPLHLPGLGHVLLPAL